ncbi:MAG TPA: hypothetical protein VMV79_01795 [Alphaproteobacteria bacterium]|nr:hypothetical protein [Alphaproteobacteria bacterium]
MPHRPNFRRLFRTILLLALAGVTGLFLWYYIRDPAVFLPAARHDLPATINTPVIMDGRRVEHVTLDGGSLGTIGFAVSFPDPMPAGKLPVLLVLGGLGDGIDNISYIKNAGDNVMVGYDWPIPVRFPEGLDFVRQVPALYAHVMSIPGQAASVIGWLATQPWADGKRFSVLGFSLGALAAPAIENLATQGGHKIGWTIIAYGGAPLGALFANDPHMKPAWLRHVIGPVIDVLLRPAEPTVNLPHLSGHFLVLEGNDDHLMPPAERFLMRDAVPAPKDVVIFGGRHMGVGPGKMKLLAEIIGTSRAWLTANGAVNRSPN